MAEILGIISSSITVIEVAAKLGSSTLKLKRLWDEVQDAPAIIRQCIEELELLAPAIRDIDSDFQQTHNSVPLNSTARRSVESCQQTIHTLDNLIKDIENQINSARKSKRLMVQLKVRLKKEVIEKHHQQLDSTLRALNLSYQIHLGALIKAQPDIIMSKWKAWQESKDQEIISSDLVENKENEGSASGSSCSAIAGLQPRSSSPPTSSYHSWWPTVKPIPWKNAGVLGNLFYRVYEVAEDEDRIQDLGNTRVHQVRLQMPSWLMKVGWDLQAYQSSCGWKAHLISWNTRPSDARIFQYIEDNETDSVFRAIRDGEASMYDRDEGGRTLLQLAILNRNLGLVKFLDRTGLSVASMELGDLFADVYVWSCEDSDIGAIELSRMWSMENDAATMFKYGSSMFSVSLKLLIWGVPGFWKLGFSSHAILETLSSWALLDPSIPLDMIDQKVVTPAQLRQHVILEGQDTRTFAWKYFHAILNQSRDLENWRILARKMLVGAPPPKVAWSCQWESSTIASIITSLWRRQFALWPFEQWISRALTFWLEDLAEAGIDLEEYMFWEIAGCNNILEDTGDHNGYESDEEGSGTSDTQVDDGTDNEEADVKAGGRAATVRDINLREIATCWLASNSLKGARMPKSGSSLVILHSGNVARDWHFSWDPCVEELVGEFWTCLESSRIKIPGAWEENGEEESRTSGCEMHYYDTCDDVSSCRWMTRRKARGDLSRATDEGSLIVRGMRGCREW